MSNEYQEQQEQESKRNSTRVYFLIAVIVALIGTNVYLYLKNQRASQQLVSLTDDKSKLETDIDKIELALDSANSVNVKVSEELKGAQEEARQKITELRAALKKGKLTQNQLAEAQVEIKKLRAFVVQYTAEIDSLKKENLTLTTERNSLKTKVDSVSEHAGALQRQNNDLNTKVQAAAALKSGRVEIFPLRVRGNGKEVEAPKAKNASKLRINFTVVNNSLATKGMHNVFIRITDPEGNLIADEKEKFMADGNELLSTYKTSIEFSNDERAYSVDWINTAPFQKGTYTATLYADGYTMGKGSVTLR